MQTRNGSGNGFGSDAATSTTVERPENQRSTTPVRAKVGKVAKKRDQRAAISEPLEEVGRPKTAAKARASKARTKKEKERRKHLHRPYPQRTLEESLLIPLKIKEKNNGKPLRTEDVANACGYAHVRSAGFFYLSNAAKEYNLTIGIYSSEKIEISELGTGIVYPRDAASERQTKIAAFFQVEIFKKVFDHYGGCKFPEQKYLGSTLEKDFGLVPDIHDEFIDLYTRNCKYLNIEAGLGAADRQSEETETAVTADVRVIGQPKGKFERTAFVIMPFNEKGAAPRPIRFFEEVLSSLITPAANRAGFAVETAQRHGSEVIQSTIINQLLQADLVICDLTDHNPNVLFELGIRIAREKPVALVKAEQTGPIFDVDHMLRVKSYSPNLWTTTIGDDLPKLSEHFKATWDNRERNASYMKILTAKQSEPAK